MDDLTDFWVHTVTVEALEGVNGYGQKTYADPVEVTGFMDETLKLVRDKTGAQVVSSSTFYCPTSSREDFPAGSKVTYDSAVSEVITCRTLDSGELDLPDHLMVRLT